MLTPAPATDRTTGSPVATAKPLLSILIPSFEYPEGIARILTILADSPSPIEDVEVVVSDDSTTQRVSDAVNPFFGRLHALKYTRNTPALGAAANWNALIERATGEYCLILHHDDLPSSPTFLQGLLDDLVRAQFPDVLVLDCLIVNDATGNNTLNAPRWIRSLVALHMPGYLFCRNLVGPPSVVVAKRAIYPKFDQNLKWLIDVDAYCRLFSSATTIHFSEETRVGSIPKRTGSITAELMPSLGALRLHELRHLRTMYPHHIGLSVMVEHGLWRRAARTAERIFWLAFKVAAKTSALLSPQPVPSSEMLRRLRCGNAADGTVR